MSYNLSEEQCWLANILKKISIGAVAAAEILASYGLAYDSGGAGNDTRRHEFITRRELLFMKSRKSQNK